MPSTGWGPPTHDLLQLKLTEDEQKRMFRAELDAMKALDGRVRGSELVQAGLNAMFAMSSAELVAGIKKIRKIKEGEREKKKKARKKAAKKTGG